MWMTVRPDRWSRRNHRWPFLRSSGKLSWLSKRSAHRRSTSGFTASQPTRRGRRGAARAARGQALVEFALLFPLILLLVLGATDVATLLDDHLDVVYAARTAARIGSILGTAPASDCAIVGAIRAALNTNRNLQVQRIVIYHADATGAPIGSDEDVYAGSAVCTSSATISPPATSLGWPPGQRSTTPLFEDSLGVEIDFTYTFQLDLLGFGQFSGSDHAVMPLEVVIGTPIPPSGVGA